MLTRQPTTMYTHRNATLNSYSFCCTQSFCCHDLSYYETSAQAVSNHCRIRRQGFHCVAISSSSVFVTTVMTMEHFSSRSFSSCKHCQTQLHLVFLQVKDILKCLKQWSNFLCLHFEFTFLCDFIMCSIFLNKCISSKVKKIRTTK